MDAQLEGLRWANATVLSFREHEIVFDPSLSYILVRDGEQHATRVAFEEFSGWLVNLVKQHYAIKSPRENAGAIAANQTK